MKDGCIANGRRSKYHLTMTPGITIHVATSTQLATPSTTTTILVGVACWQLLTCSRRIEHSVNPGSCFAATFAVLIWIQGIYEKIFYLTQLIHSSYSTLWVTHRHIFIPQLMMFWHIWRYKYSRYDLFMIYFTKNVTVMVLLIISRAI